MFSFTSLDRSFIFWEELVEHCVNIEIEDIQLTGARVEQGVVEYGSSYCV
jgi:hypothetical protein